MTKAFGFAACALFTAVAGTAAAQLTDGGGGRTNPTAGTPLKLNAGQCSEGLCRLRVHATGNCTVTVDPEWVLINATVTRIVWEIDQGDFYFPDFGGVMLDPQYAGQIGNSEGLLLGQKVDAHTWEATDYNYGPALARYSVTVVNKRTGASCRVDPGVINDWP